jgi:FkbM family methyltransferase
MRLPGGRQARLWSRGDDWVSNQVFWRGWDGYEPEVTPLFWRLAERSRVTFDVGAHVGFYTILAAVANPRSTVVALEPLPVVYERLSRNVRLNGLLNVVTARVAAGADDTSAAFFHVAGVIPCSSSLSRSFMEGAPDLRALVVEVRRIDTLLSVHRLKGLDLIKLDTETTEPDVLAGMGEVLQRDTPDIICEVLPRADAAAINDLLIPVGYRFFLLTDKGPRPRSEVEADETWRNWLFSSASEAA